MCGDVSVMCPKHVNQLNVFCGLLLVAGSYLYATSTGAEVLLTSTIIKDNFCKVSFSFSISPSAELTVHVDGLGLIWSSIEAPLVAGWSEQTIHIESPDVKIMENRSLSFVAKVGSSPSLYITALDNVTLHPCIDCTKPGSEYC